MWAQTTVLMLLAVILITATSFHISCIVPSRQAKTSLSDSTTISYAEASLIRTRAGHNAAIHHYRQLLLSNPQDTSAATRIAASETSLPLLAKVGWQYSQLNNDHQTTTILTDQDWEEDIEKLHKLFHLSNYQHSFLRKYIFNLSTGIVNNNDVDDGEKQHQQSPSLGKYKNDYPMGPTYVRPLVAGQGLDLDRLIDSSGRSTSSAAKSKGATLEWWLPSLQCLSTLFLLSSCIPKQLLVESIIGGEETLELLLRLGLVFVFDTSHELGDQQKGIFPRNEGVEEEWVVPLIHLFPLEIPPLRSSDGSSRKHMILMTDLHPNVLGMTSVPKAIDGDDEEEGAVMYIGPDSLALVHHLHASMLQYTQGQQTEKTSSRQSFRRVLDVCCGSGVQGLATLAMLDFIKCEDSVSAGMADHKHMAIALDINERALRFTRFNARLNGYSDSIFTVHGDLLSGKAHQAIHGEVKGDDDFSLVEVLLNKLPKEKNRQPYYQHGHEEEEQTFDIFLANPPFIPVPPSRSDDAAASLRDEDRHGDTSTPRYGLFSSGGKSGEDCLRAIVQLAPSLLRPDGGLLAVVSEFMNPPPLPCKTVGREDSTDGLTSKIEKWWSPQFAAVTDAEGILFTNEYALGADTYAQRRAVNNDEEDMNVWKKHLCQTGIHSVSPGLLFVQTNNSESNRRQTNGKGLKMRHQFTPKSNRNQGSIWTPHNFDAVEFTRDKLMDLFR